MRAVSVSSSTRTSSARTTTRRGRTATDLLPPTHRAYPVNARGFSLTLKIFLGTALVVVLVVGLVYFVTSRSANQAADASVNRTLNSAREAVAAQLTGRANSTRGRAEIFAGVPQF